MVEGTRGSLPSASTKWRFLDHVNSGSDLTMSAHYNENGIYIYIYIYEWRSGEVVENTYCGSRTEREVVLGTEGGLNERESIWGQELKQHFFEWLISAIVRNARTS